jgi:hypothetical protein
VRVEEEGAGAYLIINSPKRDFVHGEIRNEVWDDWVENEDDLRDYFGSAHGRGWVVEWLDWAEEGEDRRVD